LTVGVALRPWPVGGRVDGAVRDAVVGTARLLGELGHRVVVREVPVVDPTGMGSFAPRYVSSAAAAAAQVDRPAELASSTRAVAALGRLYSPALVAAAMRYSRRVTERVNRVFDDVDVVLSPVAPRPALRIGELADRSWLAMLLGAQRFVGFTALWNLVGNPAASVPAGWTDRGLPLAVQVVGRPEDEVTVLSVAAQLEAERPWADLRPPTAE
jgi:amidase